MTRYTMRKFKSIAVMIFLLFTMFGCNNNSGCDFSFEGFDFKLPSKIGEMKSQIPLSFHKYTGFGESFEETASGFTSYNIQIDNGPIWSGSDNVEEEYFYDEKVVGLIFSRDYDEGVFSNLIDSLSLAYNCSFASRTIMHGNKKISYEVANVNDGCTIYLSREKFMRLGFYSGLSGAELEDYIKCAL